MDRQEAVNKLRALGVVLVEHEDVAELRRQIDRSRAANRQKVFAKGSQCLRKHRFNTEEAARKEAKRIGNNDVRQYRCEYCKLWHNGKTPRNF